MRYYLLALILFASLILTFSIFTEIAEGLTATINPFSIQTVGITPININKEFDVSQDYKQIKLPDNLVSLEVSGSVSLNNVDSYARVILKDKNDNEYLIYEASYPLTPENTPIQFTELCEETCILNYVNYDSLRIELFNAKMRITSLKYETDFEKIKPVVQNKGIDLTECIDEKKCIDVARSGINSLQNKEKIRKLNERKNKKWVAGETSVSQLSYQEKEGLFGGELPNLYGFEYYKGGIFEIPSTQTILAAQARSSSSLPSYFDWRYRHGADNPNSPYYNRGNGWVTPVKNQGNSASCWAFSAAGTVEALINLYFNQILNIDLSEQDLCSCSGAGTCKGGGYTDKALKFIEDSGIVDEDCFEYKDKDIPCERCLGWQQRIWKISSMGIVANNEEDVKKTLIKKGPLDIEMPWPENRRHTMVLVGYGTLHAGDFITKQSDVGEDILVKPEDEGRTYWIVKNSWGYWGVEGSGYGKLLIPIDVFSRTKFYWSGQPIPPPVQSYKDEIYEIYCVDEDRDGYCNWGLGEKPITCNAAIGIIHNCCPYICKPEEDCDDSNDKLGPFTTDLNCMLGDLNKDCSVDIIDVAKVAIGFGKNFWDVWPEDVNHDCVVDGNDEEFCSDVMNKFNQVEWDGLKDSEKKCDVDEPYRVIDVRDISKIGRAYGKNRLDWEYKFTDLNNDCKIDILDIANVALQFGKMCEG